MSVPEPPDVARELSIVEAALDRHDLHHAVHHLGTVLRLDPASARAGGLLDRIAAAAPEGGLALLPSQALSAEGAAVRACLLARRGLLDDAVGLVFSLSLAVPEVPFATLALGWLADPAAAAKVRPEVVTDCSVAIFDRYPDGVEDPALRHAQEPLLETFALVLAAHPDADQAHCMASAAARRLGRNDLAIAWARQVLEREPSYPAALMLGYALRDDGRPVEAEAAFRRAIELDPREPLVRVDLAELLCDNGRAKDGLAELDHVLREEPEHERALPVALWRRWQLDHDPVHAGALLDYLDRHPDRSYGHHLVPAMATPFPWVCFVPEPGDAIINGFREGLGRSEEKGALALPLKLDGVRLSHIESPSALLTVALLAGTALGDRIKVQRVQRPDPRVPRRRVRHLLWHYRGKLPRAAVDPPSPAAAQAAAELAAGRYFAPRYRVDHARALLRVAVDRPVAELLGLMAHPPPPPPELLPAAWEWVRRVQVLAALAVAQLDGGWQGSARREVLLDLAVPGLDPAVTGLADKMLAERDGEA
jgi:tetratricopeptide (TPR) repeat protein